MSQTVKHKGNNMYKGSISDQKQLK